MIVNASMPEFSEVGIPNFPYSKPFIHQHQFFINRNKDIILKSPTCSGKTYAFLFSFINDYLDAKKSNERIKCLYLAPTRLLMHSQLRNLAKTLDQF
ncbi:MAG: DEAD/DEAH box helicase, partial [Candidatus Bathyarchaeota archaeon]|nr:DEAD/DEAH box helicase [Candidatus Bathyarchaeota archaeon]